MPTIRSDLFYPANIPGIVSELVGVYGAGLPSETLDDITTKVIQAFPQGGDPNAVRSYAIGLIQGAVGAPVAITASSIDTPGPGTLTIGGVNATTVTLGKAGVVINVPTGIYAGALYTGTIDTVVAAPLSVGGGVATSVALGKAGVPATAAGGIQTISVDTAVAGTLGLGTTTATLVQIGKAGVAAIVSSLDSIGAAPLYLGLNNATSVGLGKAGVPVNVPGIVSAAASPIGTVAAIYNQATQQVVANLTNTVINFETVELDTDAAVTVGAAWKFTCPAGKGGLYLVTACHSWQAFAAAATRLITMISKNAIDYWLTSDEVAVGGLPINSATAWVVLAPTDTIQIKVMQNSGVNETTINAAGWETRVCIVRMAGS
jgi:hypothetical protein